MSKTQSAADECLEFLTVGASSPHYDCVRNALRSARGSEEPAIGSGQACAFLLYNGEAAGFAIYFVGPVDLESSSSMRVSFVSINPKWVDTSEATYFLHSIVFRLKNIAMAKKCNSLHVAADLAYSGLLGQQGFQLMPSGGLLLYSFASNVSSATAKKRSRGEFENPQLPPAGAAQRDFANTSQRHERSVSAPPSTTDGKLHTITMMMKYLRMVASGRKSIEGRINHGMVLRFQPGQKLKFFCGSEYAVCDIKAVRTYDSFRSMLSAEGVSACLPDVQNLEQAVQLYDKIPSYTERSRQHGVRAIEISLLTKSPNL